MTQDMINKIMIEENIFPRWEHNIPTLGTKHSQAGNKTGLRLAVTLLLMMVAGVNDVKAQDYSGTYYIAYYGFGSGYYNDSNPANNYYWCPVECKTGTWEGWFDFYLDDDTDNDTNKDTYSTTDTGMDFLTTYKCRDGVYESRNAQWIITKHETLDAYYIQHKESSKYLTMNGSMKNAGSTNRLRVHLQEDIAPNNKSLFEIVKHEVKTYGTSYVIKPYSQNQYINVSGLSTNSNTGNYDELYGTNGKTDGPTGLLNVGGTLGWYSDINDKNGQWFLEDYITRPTIGYSGGNEVTITYPTSATVYYTTDGSDPTDDTNQNRSFFTGTSQTVAFTNVAVVKAAAKIGEEYSNVATYVYVHTGSSNTYLLQSVENTNFYMLAGDARNETTTTVNTSSLPQAGMSWHFEDAGIVNGVQCYYIYNTSATGYLRRDGNNFYIQSTKADNNDYKFAVIPYYHEGILAGFNLYNIGKSQYIYKSTANNVVGNGSNGAVNLSADGSQAVARWNLILVANKSFPSPVTVSDNTSATYYTFASKDATAQLITPPTGTATYVKTSNGVSDYQKWYFKAAGDDGWATYYYILNAVTGEALYFGKDAASTTISDALEIGVLPETPTDNYKFALAHTVTEGEFYIIPKPLAQFTKTNYSGVWYVNTSSTLQTQSNRANNKIKWRIDEVENYVALPYINYNAATNTATISCTTVGATIYYTTDDSDPTDSNNPNRQSFTDPISFTNVTVVKAVASLNNQNSTIVTNVYVPAGSGSPYLFQNVERTDFYMIPGDVKSGNTEVNTSSLFRPTMSWYFSDAGSVGGVQYYYIINSSTGDYLYHTIVDIGKECAVYMKTSNEFGDATDKTGYMFTLVQGYSDAEKNNPDGFHIVPKSQITASNYCIYKGGWTGEGTIANASADVMKGSTNARRPEQKHTRWNFIAAPDNKLPASLTYDSTNPDDDNWPAFLSSSTATKYFKIENVGTAGRYMCPPTGEAAVGTATTGDNDLAWYVIEAGHDDWRKYYYIVHASTGKYLKFNQTIADPPSSMTGVSSVLSLLDYDNSASDRYQFVFAKSTIDGAYYIVPKGLEDATYNSYYALYLDGTNPIKSNKNRASDSYKWKFVAADLFCNNPVFGESGGNITITCNTNGAEIRYTTNGDDPSADGVTYSVYPPTEPLSASDQQLIKVCAVVSDGAPTPNTASSDVVTLLNKPDVTLETGPYTYKGTAWEPAVTSVSIGTISTTSGYTVSYSSEHTNVGDVDVTVTDANASDTWYIMNASTSFTISPVALTVTADAKTKEYGDDDPALTYTSAGLIGTDAITGDLSREAGEDVGTYAIGQGALTAGSNYAITYTPANLTITKKSIGDGTTPAAGIAISIDGNNVVTVSRTSPTSVDLTQNTDFTVSDPVEEEGNQVWTITGIGNYDGGAKVMRISLTFNETEIATGSNVHDVTPYKASANMTIDGLDAYKVTHVNMTKRIVTIKKINYVKKDEPLLLLTDLAGTELNYVGTATPLYVAEGDVADTSDNLLQVSPEGGKPVAFGEVYMYYQGKFVMTTGGTLPEGKFYLDNPNPPSSSGGGGTSNAPLRIVIDDTTDMEDVKIMMEDEREDHWYTLDGRRLNGKPTRKGLYLKEGKKIVIR